MFDWRETQIGDHVAVAILIIRSRVVGIEAARADRIIEDVDLAVARQRFTKCSVSPAFAGHRESGRTGTLFRKNLNDAGQCARSVNRALRSARDFDSLEIVRGQIGEIELAGESLIDRNAVE